MKRSVTTLIIALDVIIVFYFVFGFYLPSKLKAIKLSLPPPPQQEQNISLSQIINNNDNLSYEVEKTSELPNAKDIKSMPGPEFIVEAEKEADPTEELTPVAEPQTVTHPSTSIATYQPLKEGFYSGKYQFTVSEELKGEVEFWKNIYAKYDEHYTVLHDSKNLSIVYGVLDFTPLYKSSVLSKLQIEKQREEATEDAKEKIEEVLLKLNTNPNADSLSDSEWNIKKMFRQIEGEDKFLKATEDKRIRAQQGLKNKFEEGLIESGAYLGKIEEIFKKQGIPKEVTRLVFVESMFNLNARSKVGASGIWQFMPNTARHFITIGSLIDERNDPIKATYAAARLLKYNYNFLGTWPLTINAYNTGLGRMKKAVKQLGTTDIAKIIHNFENNGYRFASRNFYPSFLAALEVAENYKNYFGPISLKSPLTYDQVTTTHNVSLHDLSSSCGFESNELKKLNPALNSKLFQEKTYLPKNYELRVPVGQGKKVLVAIDTLQRKDENVRWHIAKNGESVSKLAKKYQIPASRIRDQNFLWGQQLAKGQVLKIPRN